MEKEVVITGLKIPFWDLVWFMVKLTLASIPALVILYFIFAFLGAVFSFFIAGFVPTHPPL